MCETCLAFALCLKIWLENDVFTLHVHVQQSSTAPFQGVASRAGAEADHTKHSSTALILRLALIGQAVLVWL